ncbi:hypothetical protein [Luteolibacter luteus]|uniref:Uncharacterized protein n=1 Tax=Luteolibacter luteus TaxID=2728835 RepID=A0A858RQ16_9BACT|nr:hypothetical protein [Luteolibacter luteus]QJE98449.1 hypothetical protein HHL09_22570 [Luteolibacter luteus]
MMHRRKKLPNSAKKKHRASGVIEIAEIVADVTSTAVMVIAGTRVAAEAAEAAEAAVAVGIFANAVEVTATVIAVIVVMVMAAAGISARENCHSRRKACA